MKTEPPRTEKRPNKYSDLLTALALLAILTGCATVPPPVSVNNDERLVAQNSEFVILIATARDTLESLAQEYYSDPHQAWRIAEFNRIDKIYPGDQIAIPRRDPYPSAVFANGYQTVPVLCYHRFGPGHVKLSVEENKFREQMQYLKDNGYHVIPLRDLVAFIREKKRVPPKSVVITIDDGYQSTYTIAFPILKEFNFPATVFLYTDFMGSRDGLNWKQIDSMYQSGLIDLQPHSKSHPNMALRLENEDDSSYRLRMQEEIDRPTQEIQHRLGAAMHTFAYPYGDTNDLIIGELVKRNYDLAVTVVPGSTSAFSYPYMLRRSMIFGDHTEEGFVHELQTYRRLVTLQ